MHGHLLNHESQRNSTHAVTTLRPKRFGEKGVAIEQAIWTTTHESGFKTENAGTRWSSVLLCDLMRSPFGGEGRSLYQRVISPCPVCLGGRRLYLYRQCYVADC